MNRIEEGTYGVVYRAKDKKTGMKRKILIYLLLCSSAGFIVFSKTDYSIMFTDEIVALKRLKMEKEKEGFPITSLREINTILKAQHPNIVTVRVRKHFDICFAINISPFTASTNDLYIQLILSYQEIVVGSNMDKIYIVMNYVEHDLKSLMETMKQPFLPGRMDTLLESIFVYVCVRERLKKDLLTSVECKIS